MTMNFWENNWEQLVPAAVGSASIGISHFNRHFARAMYDRQPLPFLGGGGRSEPRVQPRANRAFDPTRGFPGEGPPKSKMKRLQSEIRSVKGKVAKKQPTRKGQRSHVRAEAPVSQGLISRMGTPMVSGSPYSGDGKTVIRHREYIGDIGSGGGAFSVNSYPINPGLPGFLPWLSNAARNYESYRFRKLAFSYETESSTASPGALMMAVDYDAVDTAPLSKQAMMNYHNAVRSPAWAPCTYSCDKADMHKIGPQRYIRRSTVANSDIKTYDVGVLFVALQGIPSGVVGELYCTYEVELCTPQLPGAQESSDQQDGSAYFDTTSPRAGTDFPTTVQPLLGTARTNTGNVLLSDSGVTGLYLADYLVTWSAVAETANAFVSEQLPIVFQAGGLTASVVLWSGTQSYPSSGNTGYAILRVTSLGGSPAAAGFTFSFANSAPTVQGLRTFTFFVARMGSTGSIQSFTPAVVPPPVDVPQTQQYFGTNLPGSEIDPTHPFGYNNNTMIAASGDDVLPIIEGDPQSGTTFSLPPGTSLALCYAMTGGIVVGVDGPVGFLPVQVAGDVNVTDITDFPVTSTVSGPSWSVSGAVSVTNNTGDTQLIGLNAESFITPSFTLEGSRLVLTRMVNGFTTFSKPKRRGVLETKEDSDDDVVKIDPIEPGAVPGVMLSRSALNTLISRVVKSTK